MRNYYMRNQMKYFFLFTNQMRSVKNNDDENNNSYDESKKKNIINDVNRNVYFAVKWQDILKIYHFF